MFKIPFVISLLVLLVSCNNSTVYTEYYNFNNQDWSQNKMLVYSTPSIPKSTEPLVFEIHFRHNIDYKYRNIWLFTELQLPNGTIKKDTIQKVFMQTNGEWMQDIEGSGNLKESHVTLFALKDAPEGKYVLKVQHAMRDDKLQGILDVGFKINKIE